MKKIITVIAFAVIGNFAMAQDSFKNETLDVIKLSGAAAQFELAKDQVMMNIPSDKQEAFSKDFDATLPSLYDKMAAIYMETYTKEEIAAMKEFYMSPVGQKMTKSMPAVLKKSQAAGQEWGMELQGMMMKYMQ